MSLIRLECAGCHAFLQVRSELAGQQGRCPKCGATITIPATQPATGWQSLSTGSSIIGESAAAAASQPPAFQPPAAPPQISPPQNSLSPRPTATPPKAPDPAPSGSSLPLSQAMAPDMMAEIARRKKSAVLVVFETPADGSYEISRQQSANVRCYRTADMNDAHVMQVLSELGSMSQGQRNPKGGLGLRADAKVTPFELKGDRLGMTLAEFKTKYARTIGGMTMPYCSDALPGQANPSLWSEPWHAAAGIVHGRVELPSENASPTVAGVKSDLFLYHFVDGQLFRMTALFDTEAFHLVREALVQKQGPPTSELKEPMELAWENSVSTIRLVRGTMRPKKSSSLLYIHNDLQRVAEGRTPQRQTDL
jgi:hypothetical protein